MLTSSVYQDENFFPQQSSSKGKQVRKPEEKKGLALSSKTPTSTATKRNVLGEITNTMSTRKALGDISNKANNNPLNDHKKPLIKSKGIEEAPKAKKIFSFPEIEEMNSFYFSALPTLPPSLGKMNAKEMLSPMSFIPYVSKRDTSSVPLSPPLILESEPVPDELFMYGDKEIEVGFPDYDHLTEHLLIQ